MIALAVLVGWIAGSAGRTEEPSTQSASESGGEGVPSPVDSEQAVDSEPSETSDIPANLGLASFTHVPGERATENGYPVSFPRTPEGGVSMVVAYLRWMSSNSSQRLASVMNTYHETDVEVTAEMVREEILDARERDISRIASNNGIYFDRDSFPVPMSTFEITPVGVAWWDGEADSMDVVVLVDEQFYISMGENYIRRYVYEHTIVWNPAMRGGDWLITESSDRFTAEFRVHSEEELYLDHPYWTPVAGAQPHDYGVRE